MIAFLRNIGDGTGYFYPRPLGRRVSQTAMQVTRTEAHKDLPTDTQMVIKVVDLSDKDAEWRKLFGDVQSAALNRLRHPNLIICSKGFRDPTGTCWCLEFELYHCNLLAAVRNHDGKRLPESKGRDWCRQIVQGLSYLHSQQWPHRDLKMENILLTAADNIVLTDFAFTYEQKTGLPNPMTGSLTYASPELLMEEGKSDPFVADVWALGVVFYAMHCPTRLFHEESDRQRIQAEHQQLRHRIHSMHFSPQLKSLLTRLLTPDPGKRIPLSDVLQEPWFLIEMAKTYEAVEDVPSSTHHHSRAHHVSREQKPAASDVQRSARDDSKK